MTQASSGFLLQSSQLSGSPTALDSRLCMVSLLHLRHKLDVSCESAGPPRLGDPIGPFGALDFGGKVNRSLLVGDSREPRFCVYIRSKY